MFRSVFRRVVGTTASSLLVSASVWASNEVVIVSPTSNPVLSGIVGIHVELHATNNEKILGVNFFMDGEPTMSIQNPHHSLNPPIVGRWSTMYVSNGWHTLQAFAGYRDASKRFAGGESEYSSQVMRVQTSNPIVLPDFPTTFGNEDTGVAFAFPIRALLASPNATWKVTVSTLSNQVLRVLTGTTSNDAIEAVWDGKDSAGVRVKPEAIQIDVETASMDGERTTAKISQRVWAQGHP